MTQQEINDYNKRCASFLGWVYVSSIDVKEEKYHKSIQAGWYAKVPKVLAPKLTQHLYKGRSHNSLKFDSDWNWIHEVIDKIKTLNLESNEYYELTHLFITSSKKRVVQTIWEFLNFYYENNKNT